MPFLPNLDKIIEIKPNQILNPKSPAKKFFKWISMGLLSILLVVISSLYLYWNYFYSVPKLFPVNEFFVIEENTSLKEIAAWAEKNHLIKSNIALYLVMSIYHNGETLKAGTYFFERPLNLRQLTAELISGNPNAGLIRLTLIEGEPNTKIAERIIKALPGFNVDQFLSMASTSEGMLFPETYFIRKDFSAKELFELLSLTHLEKTNKIWNDFSNELLDQNEIIILASILEREANSSESMKMVSGILQNRLLIGMALQADATMEYVLDKPLSLLTPDDLEIDSPYNTYLYKGLPPTPIGNPGLTAIKAALEPTDSNYLFYITGNDGIFYYAEDFDQHRLNIAKHLR